MENRAGTRRRRNLFATFEDAPGIVLSDIDPPYLNALLPKPFVAAPIDGNHNYCYSQLWHYGKAEAVQLVANGLGRATPVYALLLPSKDDDQDIQTLAVDPRLQLETEREIQYKSCNHDIDKGCRCSDLRTPHSRSVEWCQMKLSVVIPCYNERSTIEAVVDAVRSAPVEDIEIIVVDDGSTDGTRELLKAKPPGWVDKLVLQEAQFREGSSFAYWFPGSYGRRSHRSRRRPGV